MVDALVGSIEVVALGGPSTVDVGLDFGPSGERGSYYFVGNGNPNIPGTVIGQSPNIFDMYINLLPTDEEYLFLYQYQYVNGSSVWVKLVDLAPNLYSESESRLFSSGTLSFNIPVSNIVSLDLIPSVSSSNLGIQHSILNNANPITSTLIVGSISVVGDLVMLPLTIKAKELSGSSWVDLNGSYRVDLSISMV
jgi:hypothetical protein